MYSLKKAGRVSIKQNLTQYLLIAFLITISVFFVILVVIGNVVVEQSAYQYSSLSQSFLSGKLYITDKASFYDTAVYLGRNYWPLGPLPAVLLTPLTEISSLTGNTGIILHSQGYVQIIILIIITWLLFKIAAAFGYKKSDQAFIAFAFLLGTMFIGVAVSPSSWYLAQTVSTLFLLAALYAYFSKKGLMLVGVCIALSVASRITTLFVLSFFIFEIFFFKRENSLRYKLTESARLIFPVFCVLLLLFAYNYARFGSVIQTGYGLQTLAYQSLIDARSYGLFSIEALPGNLYYSLLSTPLPVFLQNNTPPILAFPFIQSNIWGMSIFVTSPYLLLLFLYKYKTLRMRALLTSAMLTAIPSLFYYADGWIQFGYRYALDFMPLLFIIFILGYRQNNKCLSNRMKLLIILSACLNLYLLVPLLQHGFIG